MAISYTVPLPNELLLWFAPPNAVVPNKSPRASAIKLPNGSLPLAPLKLTRVVGVLA